jgi:ABC-type dipeptide/oligopeptide/nickel transport system permease subunit
MQRRFGQRLSRYWSGFVGASILSVLLFGIVLLPLIRPVNPFRQDLSRVLEGPSAEHPFGTDEFGRDLLSRVMVGGQVSLIVASLGVVVGMMIGLPIGLASGLFGGWTDAVLMRGIDVMLAFPSILLAILLVTVIGSGVANTAIAIGVSSVPVFARLVRGAGLVVVASEYVLAARSIGCSNLRIAVRHILPNVSTPIIVQASYALAVSILRAGSLGFLGLGVQPPSPEWGALLASGRNYIQEGYHIVFFPGLALSLAVVGFNLLGDAVRLAIEPRQK